MAQKKRQIYAMSRLRKNIIITLAVVVTLSLAVIDHRWQAKKTRQSSRNIKSQSSDFQKYHSKSFLVVNVIDGDTFDIKIADGQYDNTRLRLLGVDTPECKSFDEPVMYFGPQAMEYTAKLAAGKDVEVLLDTISPSRDKYGRVLAYVRLPDGRILNEVLIKAGYAYADLRFRHGFFNKYRQLQASAKRAKAGLWRQVKPDQLPSWLKNRP